MQNNNYHIKMAPKKTTQAKASKDVVVEPPVEEKPVEQPVVAEEDTQNVNQYSVVLEKLASFINDLKQMQTIVKSLQKEYTKMSQASSKKQAKKKQVTNTSRVPSGFAKPALLSDDLCTFLGKDKGATMARTEVTKLINKYIKESNLQDPKDKRHILLDDKLSKIISLKSGEKLTYFNLQSFIKHHFVKIA